MAWGAIDAAIALGGRRAARRRQAARPDALAPGIVDREANREARRLARLLWFNTGLDVLYVAGGLALAFTRGATSPFWRGTGWGIAVQGAFLFVFDLLHATSIPVDAPRVVPPPFQGDEHAPFTWAGGRPAALLVHGFLGSPADMRPLAESLHREGWTVQGLLLPGFGADVKTLPERQYEEWLTAVLDALGALQREHSPVLLIGHSMGAAVAIAAAAESAVVQRPPDGLVLLSPFVYLLAPFLGGAYALLGWLLPRHVRLLRRADFTHAGLRDSVASAWPDLDLDEVANRRDLRQMAVPLSFLEPLHKSGQEARRRAVELTGAGTLAGVPTLVMQGTHDHVAWPQHTRRLVNKRLPHARYIELDGDHWLIYRSRPTWPAVEQAVLGFARSLSPLER
jgi:carboxylesterase